MSAREPRWRVWVTMIAWIMMLVAPAPRRKNSPLAHLERRLRMRVYNLLKPKMTRMGNIHIQQAENPSSSTP